MKITFERYMNQRPQVAVSDIDLGAFFIWPRDEVPGVVVRRLSIVTAVVLFYLNGEIKIREVPHNTRVQPLTGRYRLVVEGGS